MAMFVHLALESALARIQRNGISCSRRACGAAPCGVFAVPVTRSFYVSHQWLRELRRRNGGTIVGIYFRIPNDEMVWVGHYNQAHRQMSAAEAVAEFSRAENAEGWEAIIPRRIEAKEIHRTKSLPEVLGWRYFPEAKGKRPFCPCRYCTDGTYGALKLRARFGESA